RIAWSTAAAGAGFTDVPNTALPSSPIGITVPGAAAPATYTGTLTVRNSTTNCEQSYPISVEILTVPVLSPGTIAAVCAGSTSVSLPYTGAGGGVNQYRIAWGSGATGFTDVPNTTLPSSPVSIAIPGAASAGTYTATLTVRNSVTGCERSYPLSVEV